MGANLSNGGQLPLQRPKRRADPVHNWTSGWAICPGLDSLRGLGQGAVSICPVLHNLAGPWSGGGPLGAVRRPAQKGADGGSGAMVVDSAADFEAFCLILLSGIPG
ncbi:hypothetical protein GCM10017056_18380 [Seohaeicola zhoushanensis]|uniref:Uncharacterized protein n=1 Tax=Seohaeicola zhoushanensis TaxID=1569283 RepID=A0A8J3M7M3_9RHOB|nr:hypothetical protein GCM10017056_18380 [Seohaeicola zhoushanensis]